MSNSLLRRHWRLLSILLALAVDSVTIGIAGVVAFFIRDTLFRMNPISPGRLFGVVVYSGSILISFALVLGVYRSAFQTRTLTQYALAGKAYLLSVPLVLASWYFLEWLELPRVFTALFFSSVPIIFVSGRVILSHFLLKMRSRGFGIERTLLVDQGGEGPFIFRRFEVLPELGYDVVAVAFWDGEKIPSHDYNLIDVCQCRSGEDLRNLVRDYHVDRIVVTKINTPAEKMNEMLEVCVEFGTKLRMLSSSSEELLRFSYVHDIAGITLYSAPRRRIAKAKRFLKRSFDLAGSLLALILLSPIFLLTAVAILLEDGWPIFYKQRRALVKGVGEFEILKFRTMVRDAESRQTDMYERNQTSGGLFLLKEDPRLLRVGGILRKFSIDELPQLINVLRGDMSLVGPRPLSITDLGNISPENRLGGFYTLRANAVPGMTGLWQISGRRELSFREMVLLDLYYLDNQSIMFDLEILFATIPVVLFGKGGY